MIDLANEIIKATYRRDTLMGDISVRPMFALRESMEAAKRFVLDADMSEMLGHLATAPYHNKNTAGKVLSSIRRSARLPFERIFVQYDGKAFRRGLLAEADNRLDVWGQELVSPDEVIDPVGWLIEMTSNNGHRFPAASQFFMDESRVATLPFAWVWSPDDLDFSDAKGLRGDSLSYIDVDAAQLAHGVTGYLDPSMAVLYLNAGGKPNLPEDILIRIEDQDKKPLFKTHYLVAEIGGALRYILSFLSMLNEVPVVYERARRAQPYLANGKRRVSVDHEVVRLILPNRRITFREYARQLARDVIRRKDHPVRGHWRVFGAHHCGEMEAHDWGPTDATGHADCVRCTASRTWIADHRRGDKSLGSVEHSFSVGARADGV